MPTLLKADAIRQHPEYPHVIWPLKPQRAGLHPCGKNRGGPWHISYEVHGTGPRKLVLIMGLGGPASSWQRQTKDFGHTHGNEYSVLTIDNRGIGKSDKPRQRYSTSSMAEDALEILDEIGWTQPRGVHIAGISMGGMIAQELAFLTPERIASLVLISTAARVANTTGFVDNMTNRVKMLWPKTLDEQIASARDQIFSQDYLLRPDDCADESVIQAFPTNADRFGAVEITKRESDSFSRAAFLCQLLAAGWHNKSPAQLAEIGDKVGRDRIFVMHGTKDRMLTFPHGEVLVKELSDSSTAVKSWLIPGQAHTISTERRHEFYDQLDGFISQTEKLSH